MTLLALMLVLWAAAPAAAGAASSAGGPSGERAQAASASLPRPARLARNHAAHSRGLRASQVRVVSVTRRTWPDGCLGLGGAGAMCTQALVKGYRAVFVVRGRRIAYRTDLRSTYRVER